ncbi:ABC transporter permease [Nocardioides sp. CFH 31398]|uniref:ABC transporter permease n=1 Tax=Nocardioides sp. CFH 31398 TaxID=2919579 RepID=UPI001F052D3A|nr:ABC transporter permease [Nocardioides sp. CFH 31398]MCH1865259.1 ABC transporter permease [Nocardioides sp. CFH 31398]
MSATTTTTGTPATPGLLRATRAELFRLCRWPAVWVTIGVWLVLSLLFGYVFDYLAYTTGDGFGPADGVPAQELLAGVLPAAVPSVLVQGMPMFGGALMLVLGALVAGSGYGWGTWKTAYTSGLRRTAVAGGSVLALLVLVVVAVAASVAVDLSASLVVAAVESEPVLWPAAGDLATSVGAGLAVLGMWALLGFTLGTLTRGTSLSVGLGLVWALVVENLLRGVGALLDPVEALTEVLPGTAAGSLVGALDGVGGSPGVLDVLSGPVALAIVLAYVVALPLVSLALVARRDVG